MTHTLKAIHPDAKGTNLYCLPNSLPQHALVGSHCLDDDFAGDVVGNAAALDVYKLLKLEHDGQTPLDLLLAADADALPHCIQMTSTGAFPVAMSARDNLAFHTHTESRRTGWLRRSLLHRQHLEGCALRS